MIAATEDDIDDHASPSVLNGIKEKLMVMDLINQLDIADGLKGLLISSGFTVKSLLNTSTSDLALILGIDHYVAKIISDAVNKAIKTLAIQAEI
ncbi:MAG TPA: hypothetical protein VEH06_00185 [Candidatus Bathyarchaeia archaeon]|nr:hypothetical protein [Candidatus Bathyarchaeia archaeon]